MKNPFTLPLYLSAPAAIMPSNKLPQSPVAETTVAVGQAGTAGGSAHTGLSCALSPLGWAQLAICLFSGAQAIGRQVLGGQGAHSRLATEAQEGSPSTSTLQIC